MSDKNPQIVPQIVYSTLEEFDAKKNNFCLHFFNQEHYKLIYRERECLKRFAEQHPEMERMLTTQVSSEYYKLESKLPLKELWGASKLMANLVYATDQGVTKRDGTLDDWFIYR